MKDFLFALDYFLYRFPFQQTQSLPDILAAMSPVPQNSEAEGAVQPGVTSEPEPSAQKWATKAVPAPASTVLC